MTATLVARDISVVRGARVVLDHVSLTVAPGDRIGLVGSNGVGKSTLLGALAGAVALDAGSLTLAPPTATVGLLPQELDRRDDESLLGFLGRRTGVAAAETAMDAAAGALADGTADPDGDDYAHALERWLSLGGADLESRAEAVLDELGLARRLLTAATSSLSGGEAARASLAAVLLSSFDITLLDEPTNDLDFDGLARLERFIAATTGALVLVSHDRELLDRAVSTVVEIDRHSHGISVYEGGWTSYLELRSVARRQARERYEDFAETREGLAAQAQRQREQSVRGSIRAQRRAPDNDKGIRGSRIESATKAASRVRSIESRLNRLEEVEEPRKEWQLQLQIAAAPRSGDVVAVLRGAVVRQGGFTLGPVDVSVGWADRILVTGPNGAGKSTLIRALLGRVPLAAGTQQLGPGVRLGEIDQTRATFRSDRSLLAIAEEATGWPASEVRTLWAKFGLVGDTVTGPSVALSPGERTRASLGLLQAVGVNLLVLDEPTNSLDLLAIEQLEEAMESYAGTLILVSHDRRMLETFRATRRWSVHEGLVREA